MEEMDYLTHRSKAGLSEDINEMLIKKYFEFN
jgi:hypothetical protein